MDRKTALTASRTVDIISSLPDEILRRILITADLDLRSSTETALISKRWRSLWKSSITKLHFHVPTRPDPQQWENFVRFVEKLLSIRGEYPDTDLDVLSLTTDGLLVLEMFDLLGKIFAHGVANRARTFRLAVDLSPNRYIPPNVDRNSYRVPPPGLIAMCDSVENLELSLFANLDILRASTNFPALKTLRLEGCLLKRSLWTSRMAGERVYDFLNQGFPDLSKLELVECDFQTALPVHILGGDNLVELVMVWPREPRNNGFRHKMFVRAPRVKSFTCKEMKANWLKSFELPLLECLDIDAYVPLKVGSDRRNTCRKVFRHLRKFTGLKRVKLHPRTIKALTMVPGLLEIEDSPFKRMECVEFHNSGSLLSNRRVFNALVSYFFDDCIRGRTALFDRILAQTGAGDDSSSSRPVVVYKRDLA